MSIWTQPSPSDIERAQQRVANGEEISAACRAEGFTLSSLRMTDRTRWADLRALWHDVQATEDRVYVRDKLKENVDQAMSAVPVLDREGNETGEYKYEGQVANRALELLGKNADMFSDTQHVEISGASGGPVQIEGRAVVGLGDVIALARELGLSDLVGLDAAPARDGLPAATHVLSGPPER